MVLSFGTPNSLPDANAVQLVQITDLHLFDNPYDRYRGIDPKKNLDNIMALIQQSFSHADLLAITGDLLQNPTDKNYSDLFAYFDSFSFPYVAIAGNHDVTMELDSHLPFFQRRHLAVAADGRLKSCHVVEYDYWQLIFLDSTAQGEIFGCFDSKTLDWLTHTLSVSTKPCILFAHHPMFNVGSAWIDNHSLKNSSVFWEKVAPFSHKLKGIFVGHVHQEFSDVIHGVPVYTCPATSAQFKPNQDEYGIDDKPAGLRWITLYNDETLETGVVRLQTM